MKNKTLAFVDIHGSQSTHLLLSHRRSRHNQTFYLPRNQLFGKPKPITDRSQNHEYYVDHDGRQFVIKQLRHQNFDLFTTDVGSQTTQLLKLLQAGSDEEYIIDFVFRKSPDCYESDPRVVTRFRYMTTILKDSIRLNSLTLPTRSI